MKRRDFISCTAAATGLATVGGGWARPAEDKLSRIAIMMYGLDRIVKNNRPASPERTLDIMDIGELCADRFHVHNVELQSSYFPSTETSWLRDFQTRLDKTKTQIVQINLEFAAGMQLTASASARLSMIDVHRAWLEKAAFLGCPRVLINQGSPTEANKELCITNMKDLVAIAKPKNIKLSCENRPSGGGRGRGGQSGAPGQPDGPAVALPSPPPSYVLLAEILEAGGAYGCCDFSNFSNQDEQVQGMRAMLAITSGLAHAGTRYDLTKTMALTRELGYTGLYSLKAAGREGDPIEMTQKILDGVLASL